MVERETSSDRREICRFNVCRGEVMENWKIILRAKGGGREGGRSITNGRAAKFRWEGKKRGKPFEFWLLKINGFPKQPRFKISSK